jgi:biopolymer transport protein ExbB
MKKLLQILCLGLTVAMLSITAVQAAEGAEKKAHKTGDKNLLDYYHEGGPLMHVIALCSVLTMALSVYLYLQLSKNKVMPPPLMAQLQTAIGQRNIPAAFEACRQHPSVLAHVMKSALIKANFERDMYNKTSMENAIADSCFHEETKFMATVNYLNTFAVLAPMLGLLATVFGMISAFGALTAGKAEAADLAGGIGEALIGTGGGLLLAIPAMFAYFYFRGHTQLVMVEVHRAGSRLLDIFTGELPAEGTMSLSSVIQQPQA